MPSEELAIANASESSEANNEQQDDQQDDFPFFEGCEKRLEIVFSDTGNKEGLRRISKEEWNVLLSHAHCTILGDCTKSEALDSYILSESSLFVSPLRVVIKTCGSTFHIFEDHFLTDFFFFIRHHVSAANCSCSGRSSREVGVCLGNCLF